jgi:transketolase
MPFEPQSVDETAINTIRILAADVVAGANSGHPGQSCRCQVERPRRPD